MTTNEQEFRHLPSGGAVVGCIILMGIAMMALILLTSSGQTEESRSNAVVIPKTGTYEYELFLQEFEEEHGREFTVDDYMSGLKNGLQIQIGVFGWLFCVPLGYFTVYDWYWWFRDRREYRTGLTKQPPCKLSAMIAGTGIVLLVMAFLGSYLWTVAPLLVEPLA